MPPTYEYDPDAWSPVVAGAAAGGVAAVAASLLSLPLRSPDEIVANSLTVSVTALIIGVVSGFLWRRLRAGCNARRNYWVAIVLGFLAAMTAIALADLFLLSNLFLYALPIAAVTFLTVGLLTPVLATLTSSQWWAAIPVGIGIAAGIGLFGLGNVASGELGLEDLTTTTAPSPNTSAPNTSAPDSSAPGGTISVPEDLAASYVATQGVATYEVPENLRGLDTVTVGRTETLAGTVVPGGTFEFTIDLTTFATDQDLRDRRVASLFAPDPIATFIGDSFPLPDTVTVGEVLPLQVTGAMTITGVTRDLIWSLEVEVRNDGIAVTGETDIVLSEFGVEPPQAPGITVEDSAHIEVLFLAVPA